jgi:hypothetical protein
MEILIILYTIPFDITFRDYNCGIKLLLGHQYGSHYLYLNLKKQITENFGNCACVNGGQIQNVQFV